LGRCREDNVNHTHLHPHGKRIEYRYKTGESPRDLLASTLLTTPRFVNQSMKTWGLRAWRLSARMTMKEDRIPTGIMEATEMMNEVNLSTMTAIPTLNHLKMVTLMISQAATVRYVVRDATPIVDADSESL
jgi:hypothetical protein